MRSANCLRFRGAHTIQGHRAGLPNVIHRSAPRYLHGTADTRVVDVPRRRILRSAATNRLIVPSVKLSTVGSRAFPAAGRFLRLEHTPGKHCQLRSHAVHTAGTEHLQLESKMFGAYDNDS